MGVLPSIGVGLFACDRVRDVDVAGDYARRRRTVLIAPGDRRSEPTLPQRIGLVWKEVDDTNAASDRIAPSGDAPSGRASNSSVARRGFEPLTSSLKAMRSREAA